MQTADLTDTAARPASGLAGMTIDRRRRWHTALAIALLAAGFAAAAADAPVLEPAASAEHHALRTAVITARKSGRLRLALPGGERLDAAVTSEFRDGFLHLRRRGVADSVNLVLAGEAVYGQILSGGQAFRVEHRGGFGRLVEADDRRPSHVDDAVPTPTPAAHQRFAPPASRQAPRRDLGARAPIDVLAYLDPEVTAALGANGVRASWLVQVDVSNTVLANSRLADARFQTVGFVDYPPAAVDLGSRLGSFRSDPVATAARDRFGADLASLYSAVAAGSSVCGVAFLFGASENGDGSYTPFSNNVDFAFSVNGSEEAVGGGIGCGSITVVHEFGHNLGAHHSREQGGGTPFRFSAGERCGTLETADVMSSRGFRLPDSRGQLIYSTPLFSVEGQPCGVADSVDNARAVNESFDFASAYRSPPAIVGNLHLSPLAGSVSEADEAVVIAVTRDGDLTAAASVEVAAIGDARAERIAIEGRDFAETVRRVEFPAGVDRVELRVPLRETVGDQGSRTLAVVPRYPVGLSVGPEQIAAVAIIDSTLPATLDVQNPAITASETAGTASFQLVRSNSLLEPASVDFVVGGGTATAGRDYVAASGTVRWAAGDGTPKNVVVEVVDDTVFERIPAGETVNLTLANPQGAVLGAMSRGVLTLTDDEVAQPGQLSFSAAAYLAAESAGTVTITVNRAGGADGAVSVDYATAAGSASAAGDYTSASGTLSWADLDSAAKSFTVAVTDDTAVEPAETVGLTISAPTGGATLGSTRSATLTITDNDAAPPSGGGAASGSRRPRPQTAPSVVPGSRCFQATRGDRSIQPPLAYSGHCGETLSASRTRGDPHHAVPVRFGP